MERRLFRNKSEKMIGGVCAGMAEYFDIDPVLIRLIFVVTAFHGGIGVLAYIILWIVVPARKIDVALAAGAVQSVEIKLEPTNEQVPARGSTNRPLVAGVILILVGCLLLGDNLIPSLDLDDFWPVVFIGIGVGLLWNVFSRKNSQEPKP